MKEKQKDKPVEKRNVPNLKVRTFWIAGWLISAAALLVFFWPKPEDKLSNPSRQGQQSTPSKSENAEQDRLLGRWVRNDGGYVIEIREAPSDGKLDAAYFNPNPINVGRSEWQLKNKKLTIEIELRDTNYPGSLYVLELVAVNDQLVGTYYQAVEGVTYNVEFSREN